MALARVTSWLGPRTSGTPDPTDHEGLSLSDGRAAGGTRETLKGIDLTGV
jgi:hypothetical protein